MMLPASGRGSGMGSSVGEGAGVVTGIDPEGIGVGIGAGVATGGTEEVGVGIWLTATGGRAQPTHKRSNRRTEDSFFKFLMSAIPFLSRNRGLF